MSNHVDVCRGETNLIVPSPRLPGVSTRLATLADMPFIDALQKMHSHMVGWFPRKQMETCIEGEHVLIAEEGGIRHSASGISEEPGSGTNAECPMPNASAQPSANAQCRMPNASPKPLGYCVAKDRYLKRDDVGIFYQLNVAPLSQGNLVGATLVKATLAKAAYGCRLFSGWCAQDIQANSFWEAMGFVPLAFRTGSRGKQRIHIFWQRRVREGDDVTPLWFPSQTTGGAVAEDRLVFPIPADTHWRDAKPVVLPGPPEGVDIQGADAHEDVPKTLPGGAPVRARPEQPKLTAGQRAAIKRSQSSHLGGVPLGKKAVLTGSGFKYVDRTDFDPETDTPPELEELENPKKKKKRASKPRQKHDPKMVAAARELRDRYLEEVNERGLLPEAWMQGKYDVSRQLDRAADDSERARGDSAPTPLLEG